VILERQYKESALNVNGISSQIELFDGREAFLTGDVKRKNPQ
jgi:hypothetical protein